MTIPFNLSDAASFKAYFQAIATSNKLLGADKFLYGDVEIAISDIGDWAGKKLWAMPAVRARAAGQNDNYYLRREATIWVGGPAPEKYEDQDTYYFECETLMKQIISKLILDFSNSDLSLEFASGNIERTHMILSATHIVGCEYTFFFNDPDNLEYNEDQWL